MLSVQYLLLSVHIALCIVHYSVWGVQRVVCIVQCEVHTVHCVLHSLFCTLCSFQCELISVQYAVCRVWYAMCSMLYTRNVIGKWGQLQVTLFVNNIFSQRNVSVNINFRQRHISVNMISRPGPAKRWAALQTPPLLIDLVSQSVSHPLWKYLYGVATPKRLEMVLSVMKETILNLKGHCNRSIGSRVTTILAEWVDCAHWWVASAPAVQASGLFLAKETFRSSSLVTFAAYLAGLGETLWSVWPPLPPPAPHLDIDGDDGGSDYSDVMNSADDETGMTTICNLPYSWTNWECSHDYRTPESTKLQTM